MLAFCVPAGQLASVAERYQAKHAGLLVHGGPVSYVGAGDGGADVKVLDCFAYYQPGGAPDEGTVIRFVERSAPGAGGSPTAALPLPGLEAVAAAYDGTGVCAYADHWVSNVVDREGFLSTLEDTLGFTPKVGARGTPF